MRCAGLLVLFALAGLAQPVEAASSGRPLSSSEANGRKIVTDRRHGLCLLCHAGQFAEEAFPGNIAPPLDTLVKDRTAQELRARIAHPQAYAPESIMPAYGRPSEGARVADPWRDKPILTETEIDDVVAFLLTLQVGPR
jgi:sulfur-oxidizing protein SoxX